MPLGKEVDLGRGDVVLDEDPAIPPKKENRHSPNFWSMYIVAKRLDGSIYHLVLW